MAWTAVIFAVLVTAIWGHRLVNLLSLHRIYERRLRRTWIIGAKPLNRPGSSGVSHPEQGWSRVWVRSDIEMKDLKQKEVTSPYHLICTTLNITGSTGPQRLDRKGDSFVIGSVYSGSYLSRWKPTEALPDISDMPLARAATISAAAVSPNMGEITSPTLSVLTTLFNLRLGWWVRNPRRASRPRRALLLPTILYWKEMFGKASHRDPFIYLSDGGHFENLGIYEHLRRRCKYIIAVDATGEPPDRDEQLNFGGLGVSLRRARIDFGVEIDIDLRPLMRDSEGFVKSHFAVGRIRYPTQDGHGTGAHDDADSGVFLLIKAGQVEGQQAPDIINYSREVNADFPHDTTADQQFDSAQFESYRQLGFTAGRAVTGVTGGNIARRFKNLDARYQGLLRKQFGPG